MATNLEFDGKSVGSISGGKRIQSRGFDRAANHYQVNVDGGVSHLRIGFTG